MLESDDSSDQVIEQLTLNADHHHAEHNTDTHQSECITDTHQMEQPTSSCDALLCGD